MTNPLDTTDANKDVVLRFNRDVIERGDAAAYVALLAPDFVNRTAPPGVSSGPEGMRTMFETVLRPALSDLRVEIHDQLAERDKVTTRKTIVGTHSGSLMGVEATQRAVAIEVIDIVRVVNGQYREHWGMNNLLTVVQELARR